MLKTHTTRSTDEAYDCGNSSHNSKHVKETRVDLDELIEHVVGPCGWWQWLTALVAFLGLPSTPTLPVFVNSTPLKRCHMDPGLEAILSTRNLTLPEAASVVGPWSGHNPRDGCHQYQNSWSNGTFSSWIDYVIERNFSVNASFDTVPCNNGYAYEFNSQQYTSSVVADFNTVCDKSWLVPLGSSMYMVGMMVGFLLFGWCGDRFGRKRTNMILTLIELAAAIGTSLSPNYTSYVLFRAIIGAVNTGRLSLLNILLMEITVAKYRSYLTGILFIGYNFIFRGLISLVAFYVRDWRWLNAAVMSPLLVSVSHWIFVTESPRWLLSQGRTLDALKVLHFGYKLNNRGVKLENDNLLFKLLQTYRDDPAEPCEPSHSSFKVKVRKISRTVLLPCSTRRLSKITFLCIILFNCQATVFFGLLLYTRVIRDSIYLTTFYNSCVSVPAIIFATILYRVFRRRRPPMLGVHCCIFAILLSSGLYTVIAQPINDIVLTIGSNIAMCLSLGSLTMIFVYISELYPVEVRSLGMGMSAGFGRVASLFSTFVNEMDTQYIHGLPMIVYAGSTLFLFITILLLPEPRRYANPVDPSTILTEIDVIDAEED